MDFKLSILLICVAFANAGKVKPDNGDDCEDCVHVVDTVPVVEPEPENCPDEYAIGACKKPCLNGWILPHPYCHQYYQCAQGVPVTFNCPRGLRYNTKTYTCDWPQNVDCCERKIRDECDECEQETTAPKPVEVDSEDVNGEHCEDYVVDACRWSFFDGWLWPRTTCDQYYECCDSRPVVKNCPDHLLWDVQKRRCEDPCKVDCGIREAPKWLSECECVVEEEEVEVTEVEQEIVVVEEEECDEVVEVICVDDVPKDCEDSYLLSAATVCGKKGNIAGNMAHSNCALYYQCANRELFVRRCASQLLYNEELGNCDWPSEVDCCDRLRESEPCDDCEKA